MTDAPLVVALDGAGVEPGLVGGKGAWLDRLVAAGFAVPAAAALTTATYRRVVAQPDLAPLLDELAGSPPPRPEDHEAARDRVDAAFLEVALPDDVADALAEIDAAVRRGDEPVAARSSATAEDLHGTSFAGQYRSFLDLADADALERAVRLVWASLWHPAPRTYRHFHGLDEHDLAMACVVMRQVPATTAGVAFTVDPGGALDALRVEAVEGLGEQLVSGEVTPAVHVLGRRPPHRSVDDGRAADPAVAEVAELALRVEEALGEPQDLEWARDGEGLWLLQARPITTGAPAADDDGFDDPDPEGRRWTTRGIAEMVPGVLPPLRWAVCHLVLEEALRAHDGRLDALPVEHLGRRHLLCRVRGRAALDADLRTEVRQRLDGAGTDAAGASGRRPVAGLRRTWVALRARRRALWESGSVAVAAAEVAELLPEDDHVTALDDASLLALRARLIDLAGRAMAAEVAVAAAAVAATTRLTVALERHLDPDEAARWARRVTARPDGTVAGWPRPALVAALRAAPPEAVAAVAGAGSWPEAAAALATDEAGRPLLADLRRILRAAGSAAVVAGPTWEERPDRLWVALRELAGAVGEDRLRRPPDPAAPTPLDDLLDGLAANPEWRRDRIRRFQIVDVRRLVLRRQAEDAADLLERRERAKAAVLSVGGAVRRIHLALGARLVDRGVIEEPEDVELLGEHELRTAVGGGPGTGAPVPTLAEQARRRRWLERCEAAGPLPERFAGRPPTGPPTAAEGDRLEGWGAAPGTAAGPARVLGGSGAAGLQRGDVLVARATDASWAPLFMVATAVVVEEGGPLSHAAIVARELGIPAVVNVPGVVERLRGVDARVVVDGDRGVVTIEGTAPVDHAGGGPRPTRSSTRDGAGDGERSAGGDGASGGTSEDRT